MNWTRDLRVLPSSVQASTAAPDHLAAQQLQTAEAY